MTWGTPRHWRSIGGRAPRKRKPPIDTDSGSGTEGSADGEHRFRVPPFPTGTLSGNFSEPTDRQDSTDRHHPEDDADPVDRQRRAGVPLDVQVDAFRMLLARHVPAADGRCVCGRTFGEETGLCYYGRQAQTAPMRLTEPDRDHPLGGAPAPSGRS